MLESDDVELTFAYLCDYDLVDEHFFSYCINSYHFIQHRKIQKKYYLAMI